MTTCTPHVWLAPFVRRLQLVAALPLVAAEASAVPPILLVFCQVQAAGDVRYNQNNIADQV